MATQKNLKSNFAARTVVGILELGFSLFCFPYVAKVLSPSSLGQVDFVNATVAIFITIGAFGVSDVGTREVALHKNDPEKLNQVISKLLWLKLLLAGILFIVYLGIIVPFYGHGSAIFAISSLLILSSAFNIVWALEAAEDFTFLAWAKLLSKTFFLVYIVAFVRKPADGLIYLVGMLASDFVFFICAIVKLKFHYSVSFRPMNLKKVLSRSELILLTQFFLISLMQAAVTSVPSIVLGRIGQLHELGLLSTSMRFFWVGYYALIPLMTVLLSRGLAHDGEATRKRHLDLTASALFTLSIPIAIGLYSVAPEIIRLLVGREYEASIYLLQCLTPLIVIFAVNNFWSMQVVYAAKGDRSLLIGNSISLISIMTFSFILIPRYHALGSVITQLLTYGILLIVFYCFGRRYYRMTAAIPDIMKAGIAGGIMYLGLTQFTGSGITQLVIKVIVGVVIYGISLLALRHRLTIRVIKWT